MDAVVRGVLCDEEDTVRESDLRDIAVVLEGALVIDAQDEPGLDGAVPLIVDAVIAEFVEVKEVRACGGVAVYGIADGAVCVLRTVDLDELRLVRLLLRGCGGQHLVQVVGVEGDALEAELTVRVLRHPRVGELLVRIYGRKVIGPVDRVSCIGRLRGLTGTVLADRPGHADGGDAEKRTDEDAHRATTLVAKGFLLIICVLMFHVFSSISWRVAAGGGYVRAGPPPTCTDGQAQPSAASLLFRRSRMARRSSSVRTRFPSERSLEVSPGTSMTPGRVPCG